MGWVDCPQCGASRAAYEGIDNDTLCGECETRYQEEIDCEERAAYARYLARCREGDEVMDFYEWSR